MRATRPHPCPTENRLCRRPARVGWPRLDAVSAVLNVCPWPLLLDSHLYEEVEADTTATQQAVVVVGVIAVAQGLGTAALGLSGILIGITAALLGWPIWSGVT